MRWALMVQNYDMEIHHKKGLANVVADALSRIYVVVHSDGCAPFKGEGVTYCEGQSVKAGGVTGIIRKNRVFYSNPNLI